MFLFDAFMIPRYGLLIKSQIRTVEPIQGFPDDDPQLVRVLAGNVELGEVPYLVSQEDPDQLDRIVAERHLLVFHSPAGSAESPSARHGEIVVFHQQPFSAMDAFLDLQAISHLIQDLEQET